MKHASQSLTQTISYLKHCNSQLMTNRTALPTQVANQLINEIISIQAIELEHANEQITQLQRELRAVLLTLEAAANEEAHGVLATAMRRINHELNITPFSPSKLVVKNAKSDPVLAG
ncbi:hypothetical protein ABT56_11640 [Photobacterium aquae]|uniref:Uncharacterized protein n=1 Tax=Photobacterium aquae TaxID=1195763 RepID=A0A0J1JSX6_9GAMM|nr:hypothetical protein [Photobacterium aquae]KLV05367.1 hypothetical protein ABT56_11640 [Photobacterium aquae]